jgi:hypothetical protein
MVRVHSGLPFQVSASFSTCDFLPVLLFFQTQRPGLVTFHDLPIFHGSRSAVGITAGLDCVIPVSPTTSVPLFVAKKHQLSDNEEGNICEHKPEAKGGHVSSSDGAYPVSHSRQRRSTNAPAEGRSLMNSTLCPAYKAQSVTAPSNSRSGTLTQYLRTLLPSARVATTSPSPGRFPGGGHPAASHIMKVRFRNARCIAGQPS